MSPNSSAGAWQRKRLPHGQVTVTNAPWLVKPKRVPSRSGAIRLQALLELGQVGHHQADHTPNRCGRLVGRCIWLRPMLIHMFSTPTIRYGSRVKPSPDT